MSKKQSREARVVRQLLKATSRPELRTSIATNMFIPNHSGDHSAGRVLTTPTEDLMIANKAYVDSVSSGAPEGTAVKSTGETGGTKFLREDGDGTCSWQIPSGSGDALTTNPLSQFAATTSAQLAGVISDETGSGALVFATSPTLVTPALGTPASGWLVNCSGLPLVAGTNGTLTVARGGTGVTTSTGTGSVVLSTSPTLVTPALGTPASGTLTNCTGLPVAGTQLVAGTNCTLSTNTLNVDDAFIVNNADDTSTGKITAANFAVTGDNGTNDVTYVPMVLHGTDATPPTASTVPIGTIYIQYTA